MNKLEFVHLHNHTEYSILDGISKIDKLCQKAKEFGMPALAITDHGNLHGAVEFYRTCKNYGIKPIIGIEAYLVPYPITEKRGRQEIIYHLILLAINERGYKNLLELSSIAYTKGFYYKPRIDKDILAQYSEGLIALSSCLKGEIPVKILQGDEQGTKKAIETYLDIFSKDRFYFELMDVGLEENKTVNLKLVELAKKYGVNIVATNDTHYIEPDETLLQDVAVCIQTNSKLSDQKRLKFTSQKLWFRSPQEMYELFKDIPEALKNTVKIAEMTEDYNILAENFYLPKISVPPNYKDENEYLKELCFQGLKEKLGGKIPGNYEKRLEYELKVIQDKGLSSYFLIVKDIVDEAKRRGISVGPGRGSAAGSLVSYSLGITEIDPIKHNLLFERFLTPERKALPDVDIDFDGLRRDEILDYVRKRFGKENVANIVTFGRMKAKQVIRDVGRVLGLSYGEVDKIAKMIPNSPDATLEEMKHDKAFMNIISKKKEYKKMFELALKLEGQVRHLSQHAAGVVVAPEKITNFTPLCKISKNSSGGEETILTQYEMESLENIGLVKFDLLGLMTLTVIDETVKMIQEKNPGFSIENIPLDDEKTWKLLSSGETLGIFQLESRGMQELVKKLKPNQFKELVALLALFRPGPLQSGMVEEYVLRKNKEKPVEYIAPGTEDILEETYGVIAYQEQVMLIARKIAGFSWGEADELRKAMGKKKIDVLLKLKEKFVEGAANRGFPKEKAAELFDKIEPFARYAFNKSHSTSYALISYRTAYLKAHYPLEFICANLNIKLYANKKQEEIYTFIKEAKRIGIEILPPDINKSDYKFKIENNCIRYGLGGIKNVGKASVSEIISIRNKKGPFKTFLDFYSKTKGKVDKKAMESLIKAGAFDELEPNRTKLLEILKAYSSKSYISPSSLFDTPFKTTKESKTDEKLKQQYEKETLGFYLSSHPLKNYEPILNFFSTIKSSQLSEKMDKDEIEIGGILQKVERKSKGNSKYFKLHFEDLDGEFSGLLFEDSYNKSQTVLEEGKIYFLKAKISAGEKNTTLIINEIKPIEQITKFRTFEIIFNLENINEKIIEEVKKIIKKYPGNTPFYVSIIENKKIERYVSKSLKIEPKIDLLLEIKNVIGRENIKIRR